ncbi:MAG TPA: MFS transporter [Bryobacteraceae bacterium]|nr:MFS transporter [Bryobacteraceae bacterium]
MIEHSRRDDKRWLVLGVFVASSAINYLDRQTLATVGPLIRDEFHLTTEQFGWVIGVFSVAYAVCAPLAGLLIDRAGLTAIASIAVAVWSWAGIATGFTRGITGLIGCRTALGIAESAGIPAAGKAIDLYLRPGERALGNAMNQAGVSVGLIIAPPLAVWMTTHYGWRSAFGVTGLFGLAWIPLWNLTARLSPPQAPKPAPMSGNAALLADYRLWVFVIANALTMFGYSLWTNWSTFYFVGVHHLALPLASRYVLGVFLFATAGGFISGWLSAKLIARGMEPAHARLRICAICAALSLITATIPLATTPLFAAAAIAISFFAVSAMSVNVYSLPLDTFGHKHAAFSIAALVASYGAMQLLVSPIIGRMIDAHQWNRPIWFATLTPTLACLILWTARPRA